MSTELYYQSKYKVKDAWDALVEAARQKDEDAFSQLLVLKMATMRFTKRFLESCSVDVGEGYIQLTHKSGVSIIIKRKITKEKGEEEEEEEAVEVIWAK